MARNEELALFICHDVAARHGEPLATGEDDRQRVDPGACRPVLERGRASCVGGNGTADERSFERRYWRVVKTGCGKRSLQISERDPRTDAYAITRLRLDCRQRARAENEVATRRRAAGERRLGADD